MTLTERWNRTAEFICKQHLWLVLAFLAMVEILTFGQLSGRVGFYLDDWNMVSQLHFGPQDLPSMVANYFFGDPKIMPRPVEVVHFIGMFLLFGLKPFGYHVVNGIMEVATAWLAYVVLQRMTGSRLIAFMSAAIFLIYPIHDSTHYWVVSSSATLSLLLYMLSLLCHIEGAARGSKLLLATGFACFAISIFNYECYLPLFPFNVACAIYVSKGGINFRRVALHSAPYVLSILSVLAYGKFIVPMLGTAWMHAAQIDLGNIAHTVIRGAQVSISPEPFALFWKRLSVDDAWTKPQTWVVFAATGLTGAALIAAYSKESFQTGADQRSALPGIATLWKLAGCGILVVLFSYTIFGLNSEYTPTLLTIVNRINYAAALGAGMLFSALMLMAAQTNRRYATITLSILLAGFMCFSILANWALSRPWTMSWMMQKHVRQVISDNRGVIRPGDSVLLLNSPRYIMWSPVFDGGWDFQNVVRLTLNDPTIHGGVVSERLQLEPAAVVDIAHNYVCDRYPFGKMHALVATQKAIFPVPDAETFVKLVSERGMGFELDRKMPELWRQQAKLARRGSALPSPY